MSYCGKCGHKIKEDQKFCGKCGYEISEKHYQFKNPPKTREGYTEKELLFEEYSKVADVNREFFYDYIKIQEEIERLYSIAINQPTIYNNFTDKCEQECFKLIELFPEKLKLDKEENFYMAQLYGQTYMSHCFAIEILAKLYEKQEEYIKAIEICSKGTMLECSNYEDSIYFARIGRLVKKYNKTHKDQIEYDYDTLKILKQ